MGNITRVEGGVKQTKSKGGCFFAHWGGRHLVVTTAMRGCTEETMTYHHSDINVRSLVKCWSIPVLSEGSYKIAVIWAQSWSTKIPPHSLSSCSSGDFQIVTGLVDGIFTGKPDISWYKRWFPVKILPTNPAKIGGKNRVAQPGWFYGFVRKIQGWFTQELPIPWRRTWGPPPRNPTGFFGQLVDTLQIPLSWILEALTWKKTHGFPWLGDDSMIVTIRSTMSPCHVTYLAEFRFVTLTSRLLFWGWSTVAVKGRGSSWMTGTPVPMKSVAPLPLINGWTNW